MKRATMKTKQLTQGNQCIVRMGDMIGGKEEDREQRMEKTKEGREGGSKGGRKKGEEIE